MPLLRLLLPLLVALGGIVAWRANKASRGPGADAPGWRDTSLDEWRRERDQRAEEERLSRASSGESAAREHSASESREGETGRTTHTRLGG